MKRQSLQHTGQIEIDSCIELELTTGPFAVTARVVVSKYVGLVNLVSSQKIFTPNNITTTIDQVP